MLRKIISTDLREKKNKNDAIYLDFFPVSSASGLPSKVSVPSLLISSCAKAAFSDLDPRSLSLDPTSLALSIALDL